MNREARLESLLSRQWRKAEERNSRLARLVHDGPAQQTTALKIGLAAALNQIPPESRATLGASLNRLQELTGGLVASLRELTAQLSPPVLETLGLDAVVRWQARKSEQELGIPVRCHTDPVRVFPRHARMLLHVMQEALQNVAEHAQASEIDVRLEFHGGEISLVIKDNGRGFDPKNTQSQLGLLEMKERVGLAGGTMTLVSRPSQGTRLTFTLPAPPDPLEHTEAGARAIQVLMADDHPIVRRGLKQILSEEGHMKVDDVGSIPALREYLSRRTPDVLVLDINMPGGSGLEMLSEISRSYPQLPVLVLSVHPEEQAGVRAMMSGAKGYITKDSAPEKLSEAVHKLYQKGRYISPRLTEALAEYVQTPRSELAPHHRLSSRELSVLTLMARGKSTAAIGEQMNISPKTVGTYRSRIFEKMGMKTTAELTRYVVENRLVEDLPAVVEGSEEEP